MREISLLFPFPFPFSSSPLFADKRRRFARCAEIEAARENNIRLLEL